MTAFANCQPDFFSSQKTNWPSALSELIILKTTLDFQWGYSRAFTLDKDVSAEQLAEVATTLEKTLKTAQRVLGREHPRTGNIRYALEECKKLVTARREE